MSISVEKLEKITGKKIKFYELDLCDKEKLKVVFEENNDLSKNVKNMAKKLDIYNNFLSTLDEYKTYYLNIGDGLAVTVRK